MVMDVTMSADMDKIGHTLYTHTFEIHSPWIFGVLYSKVAEEVLNSLVQGIKTDVENKV